MSGLGRSTPNSGGFRDSCKSCKSLRFISSNACFRFSFCCHQRGGSPPPNFPGFGRSRFDDFPMAPRLRIHSANVINSRLNLESRRYLVVKNWEVSVVSELKFGVKTWYFDRGRRLLK